MMGVLGVSGKFGSCLGGSDNFSDCRGGGGGVMGNLSVCLGGYKQLKLVSWGCQAK